MITNDEAIRHLDDVISQYQEVIGKRRSTPSEGELQEVYVRLRAAVYRLAPKGSEYEKQARELDERTKMHIPYRSEYLFAIARSLQRDYTGGFISASFAALVRSEMFGDFLEMVEHLLSSGYKDPAAVLIGAVLEEHLRKLCLRDGISIFDKSKPRKADSLNTELAQKGVYSRLDQKSVTAWQDLRNKAAHGQYSEYTDAQVDLMLKGVREFVARLPA
jgi:hypothetical protein